MLRIACCAIAVEASVDPQPSPQATPLQILISLHRAVLDNNSPFYDQAEHPLLAQSNPTTVTLVECDLVTPRFVSPNAAVPECMPLDWPPNVAVGLPAVHDAVDYAGCTNEEDDERGYDAGDTAVVSLVGEIRLDNDQTDYTGMGYADFSAALSGESLTFNLTECSPGDYVLGWRYSLSGSAWSDDDVKWMELIINGQQQPDLHRFPPNEIWEPWSTYYAIVTLDGGPNRVTLASAGWSGPRIDRMKVAVVVPEEPISRVWLLIAFGIFICVGIPLLKCCIGKLCGQGSEQGGNNIEEDKQSPRVIDVETPRDGAKPSRYGQKYSLAMELEAHRQNRQLRQHGQHGAAARCAQRARRRDGLAASVHRQNREPGGFWKAESSTATRRGNGAPRVQFAEGEGKPKLTANKQARFARSSSLGARNEVLQDPEPEPQTGPRLLQVRP